MYCLSAVQVPSAPEPGDKARLEGEATGAAEERREAKGTTEADGIEVHLHIRLLQAQLPECNEEKKGGDGGRNSAVSRPVFGTTEAPLCVLALAQHFKVENRLQHNLL